MIHPISRAVESAKLPATTDAGALIAKGTRIRSSNHDSTAKWILGIPLLFSRKLNVYNADQQRVKTSIGKSDWAKIKAAAADPARTRQMSTSRQATRRKLAMEVITKSGDTRGLSVLKRASTDQLCLIARQLGRYGHDQTYRAKIFASLQQAQNEWASLSMDPDTLEMINRLSDDERAKVRFDQSKFIDAAMAMESAIPADDKKDKIFVDSFRKFVGDLVSMDERDRDAPVDFAKDVHGERLKKVCLANRLLLAQLATYSAEQRLEMADKLSKASGLSTGFVIDLMAWAEEVSEGENRTLRSLNAGFLVQNLAKLPPEGFRSLHSIVHHEVTRYPLNTLGEHLQAKIPLEGKGNFGVFLKEVFGRYFNEVPLNDRRAMVAAALREASVEDGPEKLKVAALKGAGPYMLKVLQLFGDTVSREHDGTLKQALTELKDGLPPISEEIKKSILAQLVKNSNPQVQELRSVRSLGAASVGETLLAEVVFADRPNQPQSVVIKLLKPGVQQQAARERQLMDSIARDIPGMSETFAGIADQIDRELDLSSEASYVKQARVYQRSDTAYLRPVKGVDGLSATQEFMFMEQAPGDTVKTNIAELGDQRIPARDRLEYGNLLSRRMNALSALWIREAFFRSGFFHGDLHSGNVMFDRAERGSEGVLTLIDFGNAGVLTKPERSQMLKLMLASQNRYPEQFIEAMAQLLGPQSRERLHNPENREKFLGDLTEIFSRPNLSGANRMLEAFNRANAYDIAVPNAISNFARSQSMLEQTLSDINDANQKNWAELQASGSVSEAERLALEPSPVSVSATFNSTVRAEKSKILWLVGQDAMRMRTENSELPISVAPVREARESEAIQVAARQASIVRDEVAQEPMLEGGKSAPSLAPGQDSAIEPVVVGTAPIAASPLLAPAEPNAGLAVKAVYDAHEDQQMIKSFIDDESDFESDDDQGSDESLLDTMNAARLRAGYDKL